MRNFTLNLPIVKIDEEQRIVTGVATSETVDSQGDIVDYEASKKAFKSWKGNIREMHNPIAIGKGIDVQFDDNNKSVIVSAKISESSDGQNAWTKVKEGILAGFSIGGQIFEITKDKANEGVNRIVDYTLSELSLVDNPANPDAQLIMVKSAGGHLQRVEKAGTAVVDGDPRDAAGNSVSEVINGSAPVKGGVKVSKKVYGRDGKTTTDKAVKVEMKKSVDDAMTALGAACTIGYLIMVEEPDQQTDLLTAFNALRDFAANELQEGDDFAQSYDDVMSLANKAINLRKGTDMAKEEEKIEKSTATHASEERNEEAEVIATAEDNGRPADDTEERAAAVEETEEATAEEAEAEKTEEPKTEEPEVTEVKEEKSVQADFTKAVETLLAKVNEGKAVELKKVADMVTDLEAKVEKFASLEERIQKLEDMPMPVKSKASYIVDKGDSEVKSDVGDLLKRQEELTAHPELAKPGEMQAIYTEIRKANVGESINVLEGNK